MDDVSKTNSPPNQPNRPTLEEAIEQCVQSLEHGAVPDTNELINRFPEWTEEIAEFLEIWGHMERYAAYVRWKKSMGQNDLM